jgi:hypothetical protein
MEEDPKQVCRKSCGLCLITAGPLCLRLSRRRVDSLPRGIGTPRHQVSLCSCTAFQCGMSPCTGRRGRSWAEHRFIGFPRRCFPLITWQCSPTMINNTSDYVTLAQATARLSGFALTGGTLFQGARSAVNWFGFALVGLLSGAVAGIT